jgi:hypothetical protein
MFDLECNLPDTQHLILLTQKRPGPVPVRQRSTTDRDTLKQ